MIFRIMIANLAVAFLNIILILFGYIIWNMPIANWWFGNSPFIIIPIDIFCWIITFKICKKNYFC